MLRGGEASRQVQWASEKGRGSDRWVFVQISVMNKQIKLIKFSILFQHKWECNRNVICLTAGCKKITQALLFCSEVRQISGKCHISSLFELFIWTQDCGLLKKREKAFCIRIRWKRATLGEIFGPHCVHG